METLLHGARELLSEAVSGLQEVGISDYIVIGGWCPYLRCNPKYHRHPGTIDVDILFLDATKPGYLERYIRHMKYKKQFFTSAKHLFQLLTIKEIRGERFCFNIDLLHTSPLDREQNLFVDHLDLDVFMSEEERSRIKMKSIVQRESGVLFHEHLFNEFQSDDICFNLVDFTGMFITKAISCQKVKRDRDSYDIYLGFIQDEIDVKKVKEIAAKEKPVEDAFNSFCRYLSDKGDDFDRKVKLYDSSIDGSPATNILQKLDI